MALAAPLIVEGAISPATARRWLAGIDRGDSAPVPIGAMPAFDVDGVLAAVFRGAVATACRSALGSRIACAVDHCWVRHQYPPRLRPPGHSAHSWHQDGALAFDFLRGDPTAALLPMTTCWIARSPCGRDAPGIEWAGDDSPDLLPVAALADEAVESAHDAAHRHRPVLQAGDAIVFGPGLLHRTHVDAGMRRERISIELRFVAIDRLPARMRGTRLVALH